MSNNTKSCERTRNAMADPAMFKSLIDKIQRLKSSEWSCPLCNDPMLAKGQPNSWEKLIA